MTKSKPIAIALPNRGLVTITGEDRLGFLQNYMSQDTDLLTHQSLIYTLFLTPQGKFLFDGFVSDDGTTTTIECEGGERAERLGAYLKRYKLRAKLDFEVTPSVTVFALLHGDDIIDSKTVNAPKDPRHSDLGHRYIGDAPPAGFEKSDFVGWDDLRLRLGVPDGSRDMIPEKDTPLECRIDVFHGLSHEKGCYLGQEITARMYLRGLVKKQLIPLSWADGHTPPAFGEDLRQGDKLIGQMRSSRGQVGLALLRKDALPLPPDGPFM